MRVLSLLSKFHDIWMYWFPRFASLVLVSVSASLQIWMRAESNGTY